MAESKTSGCIAVLRCNIICYDCSSTKRMKNKNEQKEREKNETDLNPIWTWTAHKVFALYMQMLMLLLMMMKKDHKKYYSFSCARWKFVETRKMCVLPSIFFGSINANTHTHPTDIEVNSKCWFSFILIAVMKSMPYRCAQRFTATI